jgi:hypothetical protein
VKYVSLSDNQRYFRGPHRHWNRASWAQMKAAIFHALIQTEILSLTQFNTFSQPMTPINPMQAPRHLHAIKGWRIRGTSRPATLVQTLENHLLETFLRDDLAVRRAEPPKSTIPAPRQSRSGALVLAQRPKPTQALQSRFLRASSRHQCLKLEIDELQIGAVTNSQQDSCEYERETNGDPLSRGQLMRERPGGRADCSDCGR